MLSRERIPLQGTSPHPHEQEAVLFALGEIPDRDPYLAWALFDLVDPSGRRYEIDLLVLGYHALYHVEIKGYRGRVRGDVVDWTITDPSGRSFVRENPYRLANHKSKVLASMLEAKLGRQRPRVETLVFLSSPEAKVELAGAARTGIVTRAELARAIQYGEFAGQPAHKPDAIDRPRAREILRALGELGIKPSQGALRLGSYAFGELLEEGPGYQDHLATKEHLSDLHRRARSYLVAQSATAERRDQLRRAAQREASTLTAIGDHPNILRLHDFEPEGPLGGPCLLFEHLEGAEPLDAFLRRNPTLSFDERFGLLEQITDALAYCHRKKVLHRALCPQAVLVRDLDARPGSTEGDAAPPSAPGELKPRRLQAKLYDFQLASHDGTPGTVHLSQLGPEPALLYRAPELIEDPTRASNETDAFSLGALAFFLFTGRPPGHSLSERTALLSRGGGALSVAAIDDSLAGGIPTRAADPASEADDAEHSVRMRGVDELIRMATDPIVINRPDDVLEWISLLQEQLTSPEPAAAEAAPTLDPLEARAGDELGPYRVVKLLGSGATSRVLRVERGSSRYALKISRSPELDERLRAEAVDLAVLRSDRIVGLGEPGPFVLGGRLCLLLQDAGDTLAELLSREGPPSLDFAFRWGEDLLFALRELEEKGRFHRDIKPQNLGVSTGDAKRRRHLFLFDFSLAGVRPSEVQVGTPVYRDPFVVDRGSWDHAADRYSAAVTLYELCIGTRPVWGDGASAASSGRASMRIDAERFDPSLRDGLGAFFERAFARDVGARHDSADAMRDAWAAAFSQAKVASQVGSQVASQVASQAASQPGSPASAAPAASADAHASPAGAAASALAPSAAAIASETITSDGGVGASSDAASPAAPAASTASPPAASEPSAAGAAPTHPASEPPPPSQRRALALRDLPPSTPIQALASLSAAAKSALDRAGIITVGALASLPANQLSVIRGIGRETAREIHEHVLALRELGAELEASAPFAPELRGPSVPLDTLAELPASAVLALRHAGLRTTLDVARAPEDRIAHLLGGTPRSIELLRRALTAKRKPGEGGPPSLDELVALVFPRSKKAWRYVRELFHVDPMLERGGAPDSPPEPVFVESGAELARHHGIASPSIFVAASAAREHWRTLAELDPLRERLLAAIDARGGVYALDQLADDVCLGLAHDGSEAAARRRLGLTRAAAESSAELRVFRLDWRHWAGRAVDAGLVRQLGARADELARAEPLVRFEAARDELASLVRGTTLEGLAGEQLVAIAAEASAEARVSARLELYPRGMPAERALRLSAGALASAQIAPEELRRVVTLRYPEAEPLPASLDELAPLLTPLGLSRSGELFVRRQADGRSTELSGPSRHLPSPRRAEQLTLGSAPSSEAELERAELERRLRIAKRQRSFKVLTVPAVYGEHAARELEAVLEAKRVSLDGAILAELDHVAAEFDIPAEALVETDRLGPSAGEDWQHLCRAVEIAAERVSERLAAERGTLLVCDPGILARYGLTEPLARLRRATEADEGPGVFVLVPRFEDAQANPVIDGLSPVPIALSNPAQHLRLPSAWLERD